MARVQSWRWREGNRFGVWFEVREGSLETPPDGGPRQDDEGDLSW